MALKKLASISAILLLSLGCTQSSELEEAKKGIVQLEKELAAMKAKAAAPTPVTPSAQPIPVATVPRAEESPANKSSKWVYQAEEDKMTGGTTYQAYILSTNTVRFSAPYGGEQH